MLNNLLDYFDQNAANIDKATSEEVAQWNAMSEESKKAYIKDLKDIPDDTKDILEKVTTEVKGITPETVLYWRTLAENDKDAYDREMEQLDDDTKGAVEDAISAIIDKENSMSNAAEDLADAAEQKVEDMDLSTPAGNEASSAIQSINNKRTDALNAGSGLASQVAGGINNQQWNVSNAASGLGNAASNEITNRNWNWVGEQIPSGVANGINSGRNSWSFGNAISSLASTLKSRLQRALGIASPSKVMRDEVGKWIPAGIAEGIDENSKSVYDSMEKLSEGIEVHSKDFDLSLDSNVSYDKIQGAIAETTNVNISSNLPELFYNAIVNGMNDSSVQVNVQARTDKGVIFEVVQEEANNFYNSTGEAPFPVM